MGLDLLNKMRKELEDIAQVDQEPSLGGKPIINGVVSFEKK